MTALALAVLLAVTLTPWWLHALFLTAGLAAVVGAMKWANS